MIEIKKQKFLGRVADYVMLPIMYLLQGTFKESPQRTHRWNNMHLKNVEVTTLESDKILFFDGDTSAHRRWFGPIPLFHMPIFGGWKKFGVIKPVEEIDEWFIGWIAFDALGLSQIPLKNKVRIGLGPRQAEYFGLDREGHQIEIEVAGEGYVGQAGEFANVPLR